MCIVLWAQQNVSHVSLHGLGYLFNFVLKFELEIKWIWQWAGIGRLLAKYFYAFHDKLFMANLFLGKPANALEEPTNQIDNEIESAAAVIDGPDVQGACFT